MRSFTSRFVSILTALLVAALAAGTARDGSQDQRLERLKQEVAREIESRAAFTQRLVDQIFSYGELGFQETESSRFLVQLLRDSGFTVEEGVAGIPTAWVASWGSGRPVMSLGSDIDAIPQASQWPGVACQNPMVAGAPGHGEGHNSGLAVNITAALAVRAVLRRERLGGTIRLWPGVAEELVGAKAWFVRAGMFSDVDFAIFTHVDSRLGTQWGPAQNSTGLVSVEYTFEGQTAHSAGAPWRGRSALDAVELMNVGWNYRREHLRLAHRSHYVIRNGGDQPNVVPRTASVWYYFREVDEPRIRNLWAIGDTIAAAAAMMTGTRLASTRVLGAAWPQHHNRTIAEALFANIQRVGMPRWDEADQRLARAVQREVGAPDSGLATRVDTALRRPQPIEQNTGGGSDDIGDVTWVVPTATLRFPSNIPGLPGHNWANAIAMATPIAHKGATAGAKVLAMTLLDFVMRPALLDSARAYFAQQTRERSYTPFIRPQDQPATELNREVMERFRPAMRRYYFDPARYRTYLEQLGITYPTLRNTDGSCPTPGR
ncbi:MAG TPA: amidohydrolase [Gemmatimonadales bacterium]|nr:amidohydrolase [Gemmatimonadales bacterium]